MNTRAKNIFGIILVIVIPIVGIVLSSWYIPQMFNPKLKMGLTEYLGKWLSGEMNYTARKNRPHAPGKMFALGVQEVKNLKGEKVMDSVYHLIPNAKFETQSGDSLEMDSLRGTIYVADFFFASCPGICPKMSNSLERVQKAFIKDDNFKIVSFTVDPERDTINSLRRYAGEHDAIAGKWYFLRNNRATVFNLAADGFKVTARENDGSGAEDFIHSEKLVLVDKDGNIRGYYSGVDTARVNQMMSDIVLLLRESENSFSFSKQKETSKKLFEQ